MGKVPLRDVVARASEALEASDLTAARAACQHILRHYSHFADVHRLRGEIALEQGEIAEARQAFEQVLGHDARNVLALLGLGVIAEESADLPAAAAHFQRALENDPSLTQLRDELVRVYTRLYGQGGRLHPSAAGLAAIFARGNQLTLARRQYEELRGAHPERQDLALALAEVRWRADDHVGAAQLCQEILADSPFAVRALYIQADIAERQGRHEDAVAAIGRAREVDPLGDIARALAEMCPGSVLDHLMPPESEIPVAGDAPVEESVSVTTNSSLGVASPPVEENEWQRITTELSAGIFAHSTATQPPLSSLWSLGSPEENGDAEMMTSNGRYHRDEEIPAPSGSATVEPAWDEDEEIDAARPTNTAARGYTDVLREIDSLGVSPFDLDALPVDGTAPLGLRSVEFAPTVEPVKAEPVDAEATIGPGQNGRQSIEPPTPLAPPPAGDAEAALQALVGNWDNIDNELAAARPDDADAGFDDLLAELEGSGITPFGMDGMPVEPRPRRAETEAVAPSPLAPLPEIAEAFPVSAAETMGEVSALDRHSLAAGHGSDALDDFADLGLQPFSLDNLDFDAMAPEFDSLAASALPPVHEPASPSPSAAFEPTSQPAESAWTDMEAEFEGAFLDTTTLSHSVFAGYEDTPSDEPLEPVVEDVEIIPAPTPVEMVAPAIDDAFPFVPEWPVVERAPKVPAPQPEPVILPPVAPAPPVTPVVKAESAPRPVEAPISPEPAHSLPFAAEMSHGIGLAGEIFPRLRARKQALLEAGQIIRREPATPASAAGMPPAVPSAVPVIDEAPLDWAGRLERARACADAVEAAQHYRLLLRQAPDRLHELSQLIESMARAHRQEPAVARLLGDLYLRQGRYGHALEIYTALSLAAGR